MFRPIHDKGYTHDRLATIVDGAVSRYYNAVLEYIYNKKN